jgi:ribulose 1,5-bisphosphate synthetase/thiazole synthase
MHINSPKLDVIIVGGCTSGIQTALDLKAAGLEVAVVTHRTYLGEDVCDSLRLSLPKGLDRSEPLVERLYGEAAENETLVRPMKVKGELDRVLAEADIPVLLGAFASGIVRTEDGQLAGLELCDRSGRRTVACRLLIDNSLRGELGRGLGVPMSPPAEKISVVRRVFGGQAQPGTEGDWKEEGATQLETGKDAALSTLWAHHSNGSLPDGSWKAWMDLEQRTRVAAYRPGTDFSADGIFAVTGERLQPGTDPFEAAGDLQKVPDAAASSQDGEVWFIGMVPNVDAPTRDRMLRHDGCIAWGKELAQRLKCRLETLPTVEGALDIVPIGNEAHEVDVLVVGGGTGGAPAGISAVRYGARTLVAEFNSGLGGVGTLGMIGRYWFGNRVGFTAEVDAAAAQLTTREMEDGDWDIEAKMQWYQQSIDEAGGSVWYKTSIYDAIYEDGRVTGAILSTPQGLIKVQANCVVDASGSAEVAARAGAECVEIGHGHLALQGTGLPARDLGKHYTNTDYDFIDDADATDSASAHVTARQKFEKAFDSGQHIDSRERRRVVGDYEVTPQDIRLGRVFPDTIVKARSNFDTHGFTVHPLFEIVPPDHDPLEAYVPLRALLPKGLDGILVTGLGISAHRDAMPVIRMQADVQNQGYAAGRIAALARDGRVRSLDLNAVQAHLVEVGILDPEILGAADSFPLSSEVVDAALVACGDDPDQVDRIFTLPESERNDRFRQAYASAGSEKAKRFFAFVLGILGHSEGAATLAEEIATTPWDKGWNYTGMGQFGESMSRLDARIIALGRCRAARWLGVLETKAAELPEEAAFSHYRALAEAFETIGDQAATPILDSLLGRDGIAGHAITSQAERLATATGDCNETSFRNASLIELHLAGALHRLAPDNDRARACLEAYTRDLRGLFAKHARRLLAET